MQVTVNDSSQGPVLAAIRWRRCSVRQEESKASLDTSIQSGATSCTRQSMVLQRWQVSRVYSCSSKKLDGNGVLLVFYHRHCRGTRPLFQDQDIQHVACIQNTTTQRRPRSLPPLHSGTRNKNRAGGAGGTARQPPPRGDDD